MRQGESISLPRAQRAPAACAAGGRRIPCPLRRRWAPLEPAEGIRKLEKGELAISREVIGLIPAAGKAARLGRLPGSKEVLPIGWQLSEKGDPPGPKVACQYVLEAMRRAGIDRAFVILREGKWDVPGHLGDGSRFGLRLAYLMMGLPFGAPYTLDQAYPFVKGATVALGFPDIIFEPIDAYVPVLERQAKGGADVVLGLFPAAEPWRCDMVETARDGRVLRIDIKPKKTNLEDTWGIAVWAPAFTEFLHEHLRAAGRKAGRRGLAGREAYVGEVIRAAMDRGLRVEAVRVSRTPYLDIGTPGNLLKAVKRCSAQRAPRPRGKPRKP
jgi:glucose-1-phosphate thymidylyltransferase